MLFGHPSRLLLTLGSLLCAALSTPLFAGPAACSIETVIGDRPPEHFDGRPATEAELYPFDVDRGPDGSLYIADPVLHAIFRVSSQNVVETVAGTGERAFGEDGAPAIGTPVRHPLEIRVGPDNSIYFRESDDRIRRIRPDGVVETVVARAAPGQFGVGETVAETGIHGISSFDLGPDGALYFSSDALHRIYRVSASGVIATIAGVGDPVPDQGVSSGDGGPAARAGLDRPDALAVGPDGEIYFTEGGNLRAAKRIRRISPEGVIETYMVQQGVFDAEAGALRSETGFSLASSLEIDAEGRLYWIDSGRNGRTIKRVGLDDRIESVWMSGDVSPGQEFLVEESGILVTTGLQVLRAGFGAGEAEVIAGVADPALGDGGPVTEAAAPSVTALATGAQGELYIGDRGRVRRLQNGVVEAFAGDGRVASSGDGGPALEASFRRVNGLEVGPDGSVYVVEDNTIRRIRPGGTIERYAGDGRSCRNPSGPLPGRCGDTGPATQAPIGQVADFAVDRSGNGYIVPDNSERRENDGIRIVLTDGTIDSLRGEIARGVYWQEADSIAVEDGDHLLVKARGSLWRVDPERNVQEIPLPVGLGGLAARLVGVGPEGDRYLTDFRGLHRLRPDGSHALLLRQDQQASSSGDGGPPRDAVVAQIIDVAVGPDGDVFVADNLNRRIRRIRSPKSCDATARPRVDAILNGGFRPDLAPGVLSSLFGAGLGPAEGVVAAPGPDGKFPTELAGVRVTVDGRVAPLLYVAGTQINVAIPTVTEVRGRFRSSAAGEPYFYTDFRSELVVWRDGVDSDVSALVMQPAAPAILTLPGDQAAALNQDGTVNSEENPARPGEVVSLFATGLGPTDPPSEDGALTGETLPRVVAPVRVWIDQREVQPLYAGGAPGLVTGVIQVNFRIPEDLPVPAPYSLGLRVGPQLGVIGPRIHVGE